MSAAFSALPLLVIVGKCQAVAWATGGVISTVS